MTSRVPILVLGDAFSRVVFGAALAALVSGCDTGDDSESSRRTALDDVIAVTSGPAELVVSVVVGGERCAQIAPTWVDASTTAFDWRPDDAALDRLVSARRVVLMGLDFEPWAQRAGLPPSRVLELGGLVANEQVIVVGTVAHTHGAGPAHSHGGKVASAWSDPALLQAMVHGAGEELTGVLVSEGSAEEAIERRRAFTARVATYEAALVEVEAALEGRVLVAADNGLEYVARAMGAELRVARLETRVGRPSDDGIRELEKIARSAKHAGVLIWLEPVDDGLAASIRSELGLVSVQFDLGAEPGGPTDTLDRMTASARTLRDALRD